LKLICFFKKGNLKPDLFCQLKYPGSADEIESHSTFFFRKIVYQQTRHNFFFLTMFAGGSSGGGGGRGFVFLRTKVDFASLDKCSSPSELLLARFGLPMPYFLLNSFSAAVFAVVRPGKHFVNNA
jgi:hypothetical protein